MKMSSATAVLAVYVAAEDVTRSVITPAAVRVLILNVWFVPVPRTIRRHVDPSMNRIICALLVVSSDPIAHCAWNQNCDCADASAAAARLTGGSATGAPSVSAHRANDERYKPAVKTSLYDPVIVKSTSSPPAKRIVIY